MKFNLRTPGGSVTSLSIFWVGLGLYFCGSVLFYPDLAVLAIPLGLVRLVPGIGFWFRQSWARWLGFLDCTIFLAMKTRGFFTNGFSTSSLPWVLFDLWSLCALWRGDGKFAVKAPFSDGTNTEYMWLLVTELDDQEIHGHLDSVPMNFVQLRAGDTVHVPISELSDWVYKLDDELVGGFSTKVIAQLSRDGI